MRFLLSLQELRALKRLAILAPLAAILALTVVFFYRLALTDLILARGDTFAYFYPYWHVRDAALRAGQLPLWSPDLFMGVPLLANSQLGTFYPPNWFTVSLTPPDAIRVSILLHIAWAFLGAYQLARRALELDWRAALLAAGLFALGGHTGAHVEQINQLQGLSWMPWLFLLLHQALRRPLLYTPLLAMGLALQFLSGHTQTVFITGVGLGVYGLAWRRWRFIPVMMAAGIGAALLASPQLIPTLEMTQVSNRRGGFNQNQATAFSFSPFVIGRGLLPSYDRLIFGEYIAYSGVIGLGLALVGLLSRRGVVSSNAPDGFTRVIEDVETRGERKRRLPAPSPRFVWGVIALVGLLLALGLYNPLYWWLASLPGFNLFRVPARWMALFALGAAMLAGLGLQAIIERPEQIRWRALALVVVVVATLAGLSMLVTRTPELVPVYAPETASFVGWGLALVVLVVALAISRRWRWSTGLLLVGAVVELFAASQVLPYNDVTAPEAYSARRFTIDQMLAYHEGETPPGRFLSISQLYFDPGDRATLEARYAAMGLSEEAVIAAFDAVKMKETLAANLPLIWGIPTIDGFDGGLLPTMHYTAFTSLMLPEGELRTIDGRLREIFARPDCRGACIPDQRWLNLTNTRYLITDKIYDLWHEDIAYDTQFERLLSGGETLVYAALPAFEANAAYVLYRCIENDCSPPTGAWEQVGGETAALDAAADAPTTDTYRLAQLRAPEITTPESLELTATTPLVIGAVTLVDERTGDFVQLAPDGWERVLSSDIKIYENAVVMPRAFVAHDWWTVAEHEWGTEDALNLMRDATFDPLQTVVVAEGYPVSPVRGESRFRGGSSVAITRYAAERIEVNVEASGEGYLVLTDAHYPGWTVTVNGEPAPLLRANVMFRAVRIPQGESIVIFEYRPAWLPIAPMIGAAAWILAAAVLGIAAARQKAQKRKHSAA